LKGFHISSFSAIHEVRYQECWKWDEFGHSYFILLSFDIKDLTAISNIHNVSYLLVRPVPRFFKVILVELDDVREFIAVHVIIHKCNGVLSILVGLTKWDNKLSNPVNDHNFVAWSHHCKEWEWCWLLSKTGDAFSGEKGVFILHELLVDMMQCLDLHYQIFTSTEFDACLSE